MRQTSSYEPYVSQLVELESQKMFKMEVRVKDEKESKKALGAVSKSITDFENIIKELQNPANTSFEPFRTRSSDNSVVAVNSAKGLDRSSEYDITVNRIAKNDIALSSLYSGNNSELAASGTGSVTLTIGDKTETLTVETTKDDGNGGTIDKTNDEILTSFANQIESVFGDAAKASVFNVDGENVQFSVKSLNTGFDNRIQFSDATGVLADITGGLSHLTPQADLNAQFTIDGVNFERSGNTIDDAIDGLSFTLKKETSEAVQMTVERDVSRAKANIQDFVKKYNEMNTTILERTFINPDTGNKGPLQGERAVRNFSLNMRQTGMLSLGGVPQGEIASLADMGITFKKDGEMVISDITKLDKALSDNPEQIANFFEDESSPITQMKVRAESYTKSGGILSTINDGLDQKIGRLDKRIASEKKYLEEYEAKQRQIFNEIDLMLEQGQAQYDAVTSFMYSYQYY